MQANQCQSTLPKEAQAIVSFVEASVETDMVGSDETTDQQIPEPVALQLEVALVGITLAMDECLEFNADRDAFQALANLDEGNEPVRRSFH